MEFHEVGSTALYGSIIPEMDDIEEGILDLIDKFGNCMVIAGGAVRDMLNRKEVADYDIYLPQDCLSGTDSDTWEFWGLERIGRDLPDQYRNPEVTGVFESPCGNFDIITTRATRDNWEEKAIEIVSNFPVGLSQCYYKLSDNSVHVSQRYLNDVANKQVRIYMDTFITNTLAYTAKIKNKYPEFHVCIDPEAFDTWVQIQNERREARNRPAVGPTVDLFAQPAPVRPVTADDLTYHWDPVTRTFTFDGFVIPGVLDFIETRAGRLDLYRGGGNNRYVMGLIRLREVWHETGMEGFSAYARYLAARRRSGIESTEFDPTPDEWHDAQGELRLTNPCAEVAFGAPVVRVVDITGTFAP